MDMTLKESVMYEAIEAIQEVTDKVKIEKRVTNIRHTTGNELFVLSTVKAGTRIKVLVTIKDAENEGLTVSIVMKYGRIPKKDVEKEIPAGEMAEKLKNMIKKIQLMELYNGDKYQATEEKLEELMDVYGVETKNKQELKQRLKRIFLIETDDELEMAMFDKSFVQSVELIEQKTEDSALKISVEVVDKSNKNRERILADKIFEEEWDKEKVEKDYKEKLEQERENKEMRKKHLEERDGGGEGFLSGEKLTKEALNIFEENKDEIRKYLDKN